MSTLKKPMTDRERRAFNRGIEAAATIADLWADENIRMAAHTVQADPMFALWKSGCVASTGELIDAMMVSTKLAEDGHEHAIRHHAAKGIAEMIREQKKRIP